MPGYIAAGKHKITRSSDIIAILTKKGRKNKSAIVSRKNIYYSRMSSKTLTERLEGGKEEKSCFKKAR